MRSTYTVALMELSPAAYDEIATKMREAGYDHVFTEDFIDMTHIGVKRSNYAWQAIPILGKPTADQASALKEALLLPGGPIEALPSEPDWFWRVDDPDESGDSVNMAMMCSPYFAIDEIGSSYRGQTRFYFKTPCLDPESDDEEELGFDTRDEAMAALKERLAALIAIGKLEL